MIGGRRAAAAGALALLAPLASACLGPGDFHCTEQAQCEVGTAQGFCEANGHCSAVDKGCLPSHRRYVHRAGGDADSCVPAACEGQTITAYSAGGGHACVVRDQNLWCWGRNDRGQLGDGTQTPRAVPVRVARVSGVSAVAAGDAHTCAVTTAGVFCWGADDRGQLGDSIHIDSTLPVAVNGVAGVPGADGHATVAAGKDFSCALAAGGGVTCWGDDSVGQIGDGGGAAAPRLPTAVPGVAGAAGLSASWQHACALTASGLVTCWGDDGEGQIGDGTLGGVRAPTLVNDPAAPMPLPAFKQVTSGRAHTCALSDDDVYCWGDNGQGQINQTGLAAPILTPTLVSVTDPIAIAAGGQHTCAVTRGGIVTCWGADTSGQRDGTIENGVAVFAGAAFSCAIASDAALFCWGDNHFGQLGGGGETVRPTPAAVPGLVRVSALAAGGGHNCATADDAAGAAALFCWGANGSGQLGNSSRVDVAVATRISSLQPIGIAAGAAHTCAFLSVDRQLRCWGAGASGQLGLSPGADAVITTPTVTDLVPPQGNDGVFAVAAGAAHTCVGATISASVLCFGLDTDGQLGDGKQGPGGQQPVASFLSDLGRPKMMTAGDAHTCAIDAAGAAFCWGRNSEGQIGDGTLVERSSQTMAMLGDASADAIAAGAAHTCALAGGAVLCWGRNAEGQAAAPMPAPLLLPRPVMGLAPARAIAAGGHHTCALDEAGTVSCWGANESGQLGNGATTSSNVPVPVSGLTGVDGIVAGGAHSCAHRGDGSVWCWGANTSGQLGDDVQLTSARPLLARLACQ